MRTILILMDSLNRHLLSAYGNEWVKTPNLDRLASRGVVFDNHYAGSLPCMPARRDLMTGRLSFLETPWGPIEPWDECAPSILRDEKGVYSHMITDHYHYFHRGGSGYHYLFNSWEFIRGQEFDVWRPVVDAGQPPEGDRNYRGTGRHAFRANRDPRFRDLEREEQYPTVQSFEQAVEFLDINHAHDNWHLHLEVFDPHEPFECPSEYLQLYDDTWRGEPFYFPQYRKLSESDTTDAVEHIRKRYAASLTMADGQLGKLLDRMDRYGMWDDTAVILTTDHGHLLGEHGYWAKNYMFVYQELAHIPLLMCAPGVCGGSRVRALTSIVDLMPTLLELHGATPPRSVQGRSLMHLLERDGVHHEHVLFGYFGKDIYVADGRYVYCRQPIRGSIVHHHTANLSEFGPAVMDPARIEMGCFLSSSKGIPHFRIRKESTPHADAPDYNPLYDVLNDPGQTEPLHDRNLESTFESVLHRKLNEYDAPECQFSRFGLQDKLAT